ncbi:MAG: serine/threonine-protein kinase [Gemmatimonadales bacterium]
MADPQMIADLESRLRTILRGRFEVRELLGAGGFGAVFRAFDPTLERDVAIKAFFADQGAGDTDVALDEAKLVARIEHPHIVPLYHAESRDGIVYLVMRCFPDTLRARIDRAPLDPEALARLGAQVADALAAAHERGVVHLDVKPDNILLDGDGNPAVTDFGIARLVGAGDQSPTGVVSGTPHYMSPEQVAGDRVDGRTDVYALGAVLYEAATGKTPVAGDSAAGHGQSRFARRPPLRKGGAQSRPPWARIISQALAKDPDDRWQSARAMATAFATRPARSTNSRRAGQEAHPAALVPSSGILAAGLFAGFIAIGYLVYQGCAFFGGRRPP